MPTHITEEKLATSNQSFLSDIRDFDFFKFILDRTITFFDLKTLKNNLNIFKEKIEVVFDFITPQILQKADPTKSLIYSIDHQNFETNVRFRSFNVALRKLRQWHVDRMFIKEHLQDIKRYGLEYQMEHLIFCRK